jgi:Zn-dependent protease with chaperone function
MTGQPASSPDYSILSAFQPVVARPRSSILYQCSLLLVTFTMLLLPLIYLALVGAAVYGVYYHAVHNWTPIMTFGNVGGRIMAFKFLFYIVPLFVGAVVVFFMFKPIFAGRPKHAQPLALNPADNPLLYAFIEKICDTVGAPSPKRIDLDCDLNASAGFRRGLWSMTGNDMVLTIGLPLVANLSAAEFAGVVAHEVGHFTQSVGMRLGYLMGSVNFWFIRVVYQRDAWDEALEEWATESEDAWAAIIVILAQIGVWFARMILRILMYTGLLIGGFMLRQREYDADACQIKLVGSETFERTHRKLATLSAAMEKMHRQIRATWVKSQQLPDNLSELLRQAHESLPPAILQKIEDRYGLERTGLFDSHPSSADRIRRARQAQDPGAFHDDRPASSLFSSFDHPARFVTMLHYSDELGIPITREMLLHVETKAGVPADRARQNALITIEPQHEYFLGILPLMLPLQLALPMASSDYEADFAEVTQLASSLCGVADQLAAIGQQYQQATEQLLQARAAQRLIEARVPFKADEFGLTTATLESAQEREAEALASRDSLRHSVREVSAALQRRLQLGLAVKLADGGGSVDTAGQVPQAAAHLQSAVADYQSKLELAEAMAVLDRIVALRDREGESPALARALSAQVAAVNQLRPQPNYLPAERPANPAAHLQLSRKPKHEGLAEIETLRQQTQQWFADYQQHLDQLVEAAQAGEVPAA